MAMLDKFVFSRFHHYIHVQKENPSTRSFAWHKVSTDWIEIKISSTLKKHNAIVK